jgi:hypothetical protein
MEVDFVPLIWNLNTREDLINMGCKYNTPTLRLYNPGTQGQAITAPMIQNYMTAAGGDKQKAQALAAQDGWGR